jgi:hypothetical protein
MGLKTKLTEVLKDDKRVTTVTVQDGLMHGENGRFVKVFGNAIWIEIFLADSRKINDAHAITIVKSYLHNINHNTKKDTGAASE